MSFSRPRAPYLASCIPLQIWYNKFRNNIIHFVFGEGCKSLPAVKSASLGTNRWNSDTDSTVWMRKDSAGKVYLPCYPSWMARLLYFGILKAGETVTDEEYMQMALDLAEKARGCTSPNPLVGCVIVNPEGQIVGKGYHHKAGQPHAEIMAMADAGNQVEGCTAYVTLEPCSHYGRTGPCCEALIRAGIKKVVAAADDPNPKVAGRGFARLQEAGVEVVRGVLADKANRQNEVFMHWMKTGRPFVALKYAMTLDGKIATASGDSKWISNEQSRTYAHKLRSIYDCILVEGKNPLRIVLDSHCQLPMDRKVFTDGEARTLLVTSLKADRDKAAAFQALDQVTVWQIPEKNGALDLGILLDRLGQQEKTSVLVEGGSQVHGAFFDGRLAQRVYAFIAPCLIGGKRNLGAIGGRGARNMDLRVTLQEPQYEAFGTDLMVTGLLERS